jgi:hypothetical protein
VNESYDAQAFPVASDGVFEEGMTLRDYFAAQALSSLVGLFAEGGHSAGAVAADCYAIADAMLAERAK